MAREPGSPRARVSVRILGHGLPRWLLGPRGRSHDRATRRAGLAVCVRSHTVDVTQDMDGPPARRPRWPSRDRRPGPSVVPDARSALTLLATKVGTVDVHPWHAAMLMVAVGILLALPGLAVAEERVLTIEPRQVAQGATAVVSGVCPEDAGESTLSVVAGWAEDAEFDQVRAEGDGTFSEQVRLPDDAPTGEQEISVDCGVADVRVLGTVTVAEVPVGAVETGFGGAMVADGRSQALVAGLGVLLLAGGVVLRRVAA